jgi:hypothetical protein
MPHSVGQAHVSHPPGPHSFSVPHQTIGLGMLKQQVRHEGAPQGWPGEQPAAQLVQPGEPQPGEWQAPGGGPKQQHPPPKSKAIAASTTNQRAIMAQFPEYAVPGVRSCPSRIAIVRGRSGPTGIALAFGYRPVNFAQSRKSR